MNAGIVERTIDNSAAYIEGSLKQMQNCGCRLPWKRCIGCVGDCGGSWTGCGRGWRAGAGHPPSRTLIRCTKPLLISEWFSHGASVPQRSFNFISSVHFWVNRRCRCRFFPELRPPDFPASHFKRATTRQSHACLRPASGSVTGVNANHSKNNYPCEIPQLI